MKLPEILKKKGFKQFMIKILIFLILFILYSAFLGPLVANKAILFTYYFASYGGIGQILLFFSLVFIIASREKLYDIKVYKNNSYLFIIPSIIFGVIFYLLFRFIYAHPGFDWPLFILVHLSFWLAFIFLALAVFGIRFIIDFVKQYRKEILWLLICSAIAFAVMGYIWHTWTFFSDIVTKTVYSLLKLTFHNAVMKPPRFLSVNGFGVDIGEACSGLYSMFLFICVNILILSLEWKKIKRLNSILLAIPGLIGIWFVNIIRIYLLIIVGVYISPSFAVGLFHSYIGSILFLIYTLIYVFIFYKMMPK